MSEQSSNNHFSTGEVFSLGLGHLFHDLHTAFVAPLLPVIIEKMSLSLTSAGILATMMQIPAIFHPFLGYIADRGAARLFVAAAPALTATSLGLMGAAPNPTTIGGLLFLAGISSAMFHSPSPAMAGEVSGERTGLGMGIFMAGGGLGRTLGPLLIVWGVGSWGFEGTWRFMVIGWAASAVLLWQLRDVSGKPGSSHLSLGKLSALKTFFLPLTLVLLLRSFFISVTNTYLPTFMHLSGAPLWMAGASLSTLEIAGVAGSLFVSPFSDTWGRKRTLMAAMTLSTLALYGFLQVTDWWILPFLLILGFSSKSTGAVFLALVQDHFQDQRATGNGVFMFLSFISNAAMLLLIGFIGDQTGLKTAYILGVVAAALTVPLILLIPGEHS